MIPAFWLVLLLAALVLLLVLAVLVLLRGRGPSPLVEALAAGFQKSQGELSEKLSLL
ncbi:MAG: hypothetical protein HY278_00495, partial [candidate division NC10 bacterium]|nr:hypothetical protein [candidate division NC10 bacterium]